MDCWQLQGPPPRGVCLRLTLLPPAPPAACSPSCGGSTWACHASTNMQLVEFDGATAPLRSACSLFWQHARPRPCCKKDQRLMPESEAPPE